MENMRPIVEQECLGLFGELWEWLSKTKQKALVDLILQKMSWAYARGKDDEADSWQETELG